MFLFNELIADLKIARLAAWSRGQDELAEKITRHLERVYASEARAVRVAARGIPVLLPTHSRKMAS